MHSIFYKWIKYVGGIPLLFLVACNNAPSNQWKKEAAKAVQELRGKTLSYPEAASCLFFNPAEVDSIQKAPLKAVLFIDGECGVCILKMNFWKSFCDSLYKETGFRLPVLIYAFARKGEFFRELMEEMDYRWVWLYDREQHFIRENKLWDDRLRAVLVDGEQKIILVGDPSFNEEMKKLYQETIQEYRER